MKSDAMYMTLKDGTKIRMPSDEEDAEIRAGIAADPDARELDAEWFARARPAREVMSPALYAALTDKSKPPVIRIVSDAEDAARQKRPGRPPLESRKEQINIRLSAQVLAAFRATGEGWQTRIDNLLQEAVAQGRV